MQSFRKKWTGITVKSAKTAGSKVFMPTQYCGGCGCGCCSCCSGTYDC